MAKLKAAVFDVDGTLYDYHDRKIHESTIEAIRYLKSKGIVIVIASARAFSELSEDCISRVSADYYVGASGHCIQDTDGRPIYAERFTFEQTEFIKKLAVEYDAGLTLKYENCSCVYRRFEKMENIYTNIGRLRCPVIHLPAMDQHRRELPLGFVIHGENGIRDRVADEIEKHPNEYRLERFKNGVVCEVYSPHTNKQTALKHLTGRLGFSPENVIAFGDGPNDIDMIKWAGLGVAMGNGHDALKHEADAVCGSTWEDGIAKFIYSLSL